MIQRKQTLFLLLSGLLSLAMLFVANHSIITTSGSTPVFLTPLQAPYSSGASHYFAIALNFIGLLLAFAAIFLYKQRGLQLRLCNMLMMSWLIIGLILMFADFAMPAGDALSVQKEYLALALTLAGIGAGYFASRYIRKDIDLLKSADRIR